MQQQAIFEAAAALSETDRMELVARLLDTLGPETDGIDEAAFAVELERRSAEIDQGTGELVPWSELKDDVPDQEVPVPAHLSRGRQQPAGGRRHCPRQPSAGLLAEAPHLAINCESMAQVNERF
jgi:putative addiction module component (TIGR02574 family)